MMAKTLLIVEQLHHILHQDALSRH